MADDNTAEQLQKESLEMGVFDAIYNWRQEGFGDEHLLDIILQVHPSLILNMKERIRKQ